MATKKISELPVAATLTGTEELPVVQAGATVRAALTGLPVSTATTTALNAVDARTGAKAWTTATGYVVGQLVTNAGVVYRSVTVHTSGATFAGDLAVNWSPLSVGSGGGGGAQVDKPGVYIPANAFPNLKPALAAHASTLVEIPYFGDSTGFGSGGDGGPVRKLRAAGLAAGLTDGGRGVASRSETSSSSGEALNPLVSSTGTWTDSGNQNDYLQADVSSSVAAGATRTFTGKGTAFRLIYQIWPTITGRFSYSVDGGAEVVVDASGPTTGTLALSLGIVNITGLSEGTHTVRVTNLANIAVAAPTMNSLSQSGPGQPSGFSSGTWYYKATAVAGGGETDASSSLNTVVANGPRTIGVTVNRRTGATSYKIYRSTTAGGPFEYVGSVVDPGSGSFATFTDDNTATTGATAPTTNTTGFVGTTYKVAFVTEWVRAAGVVFHKHAVSGISTATFFNYLIADSTTQPGFVGQIALGLTPGVAVNGSTWGAVPAARPAARNVKAAVFALSINDQQGNTDETTITATLANVTEGFALFVRLCRTAGADPILAVPHLTYASKSSLYSGRIRAALTNVARSMGVPYVDFNTVLGPISTGAALYTGGPHINQLGYDLEGQFLWDNIFAPVLGGTIS